MNTERKSIINYTGIVFVICAMTIVSCSREPKLTAINITNSSKSEINDVVVSGIGFSQKVAKIKIDEKTSIFVRPSGESSVTVNFKAAEKNYSSGQQGYFEPGYHSIGVIIKPDFIVKVNNTKL